jgi:hypothetical protein
MFPLLMTVVSLLGSTYSVTNMWFRSISLNFRPLLRTCLIAKLSPLNPIGVGNMSISIPYFAKLALPIKSLVLTPINKMEVVECKHRHIVEMGLALLAHTYMPLKY